MNRFFVDDVPSCTALGEEEGRHASRTLRLGTGAEIEIVDGKGHLGRAVITSTTKKGCAIECREFELLPPMRKYDLHLVMAPTKNINRTEWVVEKATEVGVDEISFIKTEHSERKQIRMDCLEKIAVSALKQSKQLYKPVLHDMVTLETKADEIRLVPGKNILAYVPENEENHLQKVVGESGSSKFTVWVGPEGGFSPREADLLKSMGWEWASLGASRLRTETAAVYVAMVMQVLKSS